MSPNGELLLELITRKSLRLINSTDKCSGVITRMRVKGNKVEKSALDYFIVCEMFYSYCVSMAIDEDRKYSLKRYYKNKNGNKVVFSDHNPLFLNLKVPWNSNIRKPRLEIFNLRNRKSQEEFYKITNENQVLSNCLQGVPKKIRLGFCLISRQPMIGFSNRFFLLKTEIHTVILNTEPFLYD